MPTCLSVGPYKFYFYSNDELEPSHIHARDARRAKFWLEPVRLEWNRGFSRHEIVELPRIVEQNRVELLRCWNGFFNG
jgi:hypothetical protein